MSAANSDIEKISGKNVGRIAERIVANELEYRGFRVSDLNKEGLSPNADLIAAKAGQTWQIQVKGASCSDAAWWLNYGYCSQDHIDGKRTSFYNAITSYYRADYVALAAVRTPADYVCVILPVAEAEKVVQLSLEHDFRPAKLDGGPHKPGKMWGYLDYIPKKTTGDRRRDIEAEQAILKLYKDTWEVIGSQ